MLHFIRAVQSSDKAELTNLLSFERLIAEKDGEKYLKLSPGEKAVALSRFKTATLDALTVGNLKSFGQIDPKVRTERISGDNAEVIIDERKIEGKAFMFTLAGEGGVWKIYRIVAL